VYVEVALEVLVARVCHVEGGVRHPHRALLAAGAALMQVRDDVTRTADKSEVGFYARPDRHAAVQRLRRQNDAVVAARRAKLVVVAVLFALTDRR